MKDKIIFFAGLLAFAAICGVGTAFLSHPHALIQVYDRIEHEREQQPPFQRFDVIASESFAAAMRELQLDYTAEDVSELIEAIPAMVPFPEVPPTLSLLKEAGFKLCIH
jgi:2-haloacid dehalogenase